MYKNLENTIRGLVSLLVITAVAAAAINQQARDAAYAAGQENAARKVIFAYPGTEKSVALEFVLDKRQMLAAEEALK